MKPSPKVLNFPPPTTAGTWWKDRIICGDSRATLQALPSESVHLAITSPPYNVGLEYDGHHDQMPYEEYLQWLMPFWKDSWKNMSDEDAVKRAVSTISDNLVWLFDQVKAAPHLGERFVNSSRLWYDGGYKLSGDLAKEFNTTHAKAAGVIARLSPQNVWDNNVENARRVFGVLDTYGKTKITADIAGLAEKLSGGEFSAKELLGETLDGLPSDSAAVVLRAYDEANNPKTYPLLHPTGEVADPNGGTHSWKTFDNIRNSIEIIRGDGSVEHISSLMGGAHKIRNFNNNLIARTAIGARSPWTRTPWLRGS